MRLTIIALIVTLWRDPRLEPFKKTLRAWRLRLRRTLNGRHNPFSLASDVKIQWFGEKGYQTFFGYYDLSPFSADISKLLAMRIKGTGQARDTQQPIELGIYRLDQTQPEFIPFASSQTWCWQQGCRLQWWGDDQHVVFNDLEKGVYISRLFNIVTGQDVHRWPVPLYSASPNRDWAVSLNFSRLERLRPGYGYDKRPDQTKNTKVPLDDGIWVIDLKNGQKKLIITLDQLSKFDTLPSMVNAVHYVNHLWINPRGTRFLFFHIWIHDGRRAIRMMTADRSGQDIRVISDSGHASHFSWSADGRALIAFSTEPETGTGYHYYRDQNRMQNAPRKLHINDLEKDGHPSLFQTLDGAFITDCYPDQFGEQTLRIGHLDKRTTYRLGSFFSSEKFRHVTRCDLHPRLDKSEQQICIDSAAFGYRRMAVLGLPQNILESLD